MSNRSVFTITGTGASAWVPVDPNDSSTNVGILVDKVTGSGIMTIAVEVTHENILRETAAPTQIAIADADADLLTGLIIPVTGVRFNCTAFTSGTTTASFLWSGHGGGL